MGGEKSYGRLFFWAFSPLLSWRPRVVNNFFSVLFLERDSSRGQFRVNHLSPPSPSTRKKESPPHFVAGFVGKGRRLHFFRNTFLGRKKGRRGGGRKEKWGKSLSLFHFLAGGERERSAPFAKHGLCSFSMNYGQRQLLFGGNERGEGSLPKKGGKSGTPTSADAIFAQEKDLPLSLPFHLYREPNVISIFFPETLPHAKKE